MALDQELRCSGFRMVALCHAASASWWRFCSKYCNTIGNNTRASLQISDTETAVVLEDLGGRGGKRGGWGGKGGREGRGVSGMNAAKGTVQ